MLYFGTRPVEVIPGAQAKRGVVPRRYADTFEVFGLVTRESVDLLTEQPRKLPEFFDTTDIEPEYLKGKLIPGDTQRYLRWMPYHELGASKEFTDRIERDRIAFGFEGVERNWYFAKLADGRTIYDPGLQPFGTRGGIVY